ncbi:MAG: co-chaperone GroES, partial [Candidatus Dormibacteria bacterium]
MKVLVPLSDRLVVENVGAPEKTGGGIFLPDQSQMKPQEGFVCATGPAVSSARLKAGVHILYSKFAGSEVRLDDSEFLIISERDVLAVIKDVGDDDGVTADAAQAR